MAKRTHKGFKLFILHVLSFLFSIGPLGAVFAFHFDKYTETVGETVKLCFGGVLVLVFVILKALGKLKVPRRIVFLAFMFVGVYLFEAVLGDLKLLLGAALLGEAVDYMIIQPMITRAKAAREREKVSDETASKVEEILDKYIGGRI